MKDILLLGYARESSTRVKNKMTRKFGDTTLFDIYMQKLENIRNMDNPFSNITMAIGFDDKLLWNKAHKYDVPITARSKESITSSIKDDCDKVYEYLNDFDEEYVMWINGCFPFLKEETIINIAEFFIKSEYEGLHCVKDVQTWYWYPETGLPVWHLDGVSTVYIKPIYESVHCCHIYKKDYLLKNNMYWSLVKDNPFLYKLTDDIEFMDIDTNVEFKVAEEVWKNQSSLQK